MNGIKIAEEKFHEIFGSDGKKEFFFTPGRVNLIGEHIDYNGGFVFPCALDFGTYAVCRKRKDNLFKIYSVNFPNDGIIEFCPTDLKKENVWADYCKGVVAAFIDNGYNIERGLEIVFYGNIPNGAGLSSSASLEVLMGTILRNELGFNDKISMIDIVKFGQIAENKFIGVSCGIMDQFAVGMGKKDRAILLDCNSLKYKYVPIKLDGISIVIMNTNKRRGLADSKYNERRLSCEKALNDIKNAGKKIENLCELSIEEFEKVKDKISSKESQKRAKHAVYENKRVLDSVEALNNNDINKFGELMNKSHDSLRDDYEVTGLELDTIVAAARKEEGTLGARMTGAGFGGCAVALVKNQNIDNFIKNVGEKYNKKTGLTADFYIANVGNGACEL